MTARSFAAVLTLVLAVPAGVRAADLDPYLPADTEFYLSVNVREILDSPLVKKNALPSLRDALGSVEEVNDVLKDLGFDPFKDLDRIIVASPSSGDNDRGLIVVRGTFDVKKFQDKAADAAQNNDDVLKIHKVPLGGGVTHEVYQVDVPGQDLTLYVTLAGNKTMLVSRGKDYVVNALKQVRAKKQPVLKNKAFQALVESMDAKQSLTVAVLGKSLGALEDLQILPKGVRDALASIEAIGGGVTVGKEMKLDLAVSTKNEQSARTVRDAVDKGVKLGLVGLALLGDDRKELSLLLEVMKTVKVSGKAKVVSLSAKLTADVLDDFFKKDE
jgi:hypothetical protein